MTGGLGPGGGTDWMHCNAVNYNAEFDQIIVNSKNMNEFFIIDHSTTIEEAASSNGGNYGKGGDILYRWGNPQNYQRGNNDDRQLFGQHDAQWIANGMPNEGKILIYNNGGGRPEGNYSSVDIIDVPVNPDGSYHVPDVHAFGPAGLFWSYFTNASFYSQNISGAQQQPNGNVLICEGNNGHLFEVTANGHVVWEYVNPVGSAGTVSQGQTAVGNSVFRTYRYAPEYPAFDGKDLTPGSTVESNPTPYNCEYPQNVWLAPCTNTFQGKVWLEGAYNQNNGLMRNTLTDINLLPNQQPFNGAPWLYDGTEITDFASIAMYDIVDWVLLEARSSADITAVVTQKAVLLRNDGTLIDVNGDDDLCFDEALIENESYYWVLRTRNHLDVISQNTAVVPNEFIIDFCQPDAIMGGEQQLTLVENSYMLLAGDFNGDGIITVNDFNRYAAESSAVNAYIYADLNCDASVTVADFNLYLSNASVIGVTAIRY